jgi:WD40 repeat protein
MKIELKHKTNIHCMAVSPDGQWLAVGQRDKKETPSLTLWELPGGKYADGFETDAGSIVTSVSFNKDSNALAYVTADGYIKVVDLTKMKAGARLKVTGAQQVCYGRHQDLLLVTGKTVTVLDATDHKTVVWKYDEYKPGKKVDTYVSVPAAAVFCEADTQVMITGINDDQFHVFDIASGEETEQLKGGVKQAHFMITDDEEKYVYLSCYIPRGQLIYTLKDMKPVVPEYFNLEIGSSPTASFHPSSKFIGVGGRGGHVSLRSLKDGSFLHNKQLHSGDVAAVAFTKDGKYMLSAGLAGEVLFTDISKMIKK